MEKIPWSPSWTWIYLFHYWWQGMPTVSDLLQNIGIWRHETYKIGKTIFMHCISHKLTLGTKKITPKHSKVLQEALTVVNFTSNWVLNYLFFSKFCKAMESKHDEVRWLWSGSVLQRLVKLTGVRCICARAHTHTQTGFVRKILT